MRSRVWLIASLGTAATVALLFKLLPDPDRAAATSDAITIISVALSSLSAAVSGAAVAMRFRRHAPSMGSGLLRRAAGLLPGAAGARYSEEWRGELYDMRAEGARWWTRAAHVSWVVLYAAPALAITLRLNPSRAVD